MLPDPGFTLISAPDHNGFVLGSADVNPQEHFIEKTTTTARPSRNQAAPLVPPGLQAVPESRISDDGFAINVTSTSDLAPMILIPGGQYQQRHRLSIER